MSKKSNKTTYPLKDCRKKIKIFESTSSCLTSRAGVAPFVNFLNGCEVVEQLADQLQNLRQSKKGISLLEAFFQLITFFVDGSENTLEAFDKLRDDQSWKTLIGDEKLLGTAQLKRLLDKIRPEHIDKMRPLIRSVFLSVLKAASPQKVVLFLDSCVYDNSGAKCRSGVKHTYKKKQGYHPINLIWDGIYVDTVFQPGNCSTNHGNVAINMLKSIVPLIRNVLGQDIPIIVRMDGGYYDQKLFAACDELEIGFVCTGKHYSDHNELAKRRTEDFDGEFQNKTCKWAYASFQERRKNWPEEMCYRALFLRAIEEDGQPLLGLKSRILLTNLNKEEACDKEIIQYDHSRGADELTHRATKEFCNERMPCLDYFANTFWYMMSILSFNLFQVFKREIVCCPKNTYPNTVRRRFFDIAGKITYEGRVYRLKIPVWKMRELQFDDIWRRSLIPRQIITL